MAEHTIGYPGPPTTGHYGVFDTAVDPNGVLWSCSVAGSAKAGGTALFVEGGSVPIGAQTVTVTTNAGTIPVTNTVSNFANTSAATMAITMAVTGAVDGQVSIVRVFDFSASSETIGWTNTENGTVSAPTTSAGSVTLPKTVTFMFNGKTSKWRCIASA